MLVEGKVGVKSMDEESLIIEKAKNGFNNNLLLENYHKIHSDNAQLVKLIELINIEEKRNYLDLGTGNGYVAFEVAKLSNKINVYGLDIAEKAIKRNREISMANGISNIIFDVYVYDGSKFPYNNECFKCATSR